MLINFRELPDLKNFAWTYFREDRDFEKYFFNKERDIESCVCTKSVIQIDTVYFRGTNFREFLDFCKT